MYPLDKLFYEGGGEGREGGAGFLDVGHRTVGAGGCLKPSRRRPHGYPVLQGNIHF